jgi:glycosyltransferase involved in cell wall biosynthesis
VQTIRILEVGTSGTIGTVHMGPVSTVICQLSNHFAARGHEVVLADVRSENPRQLLHPNIRVVELSARSPSRIALKSRHRLGLALRKWSNFYKYVRELTAQIDVTDTDVVHIHSAEIAFLLQRIHGVQASYTAHTPLWSLQSCDGLNSEGRKATLAGGLYARMHEWMEREVVRRSKLTVGLGNYLKAAVAGADIVTIPNGLDFDAWCPMERAAARQALGIDPGDFVVLFTGRIAHVKGVDVLVEAIRSLAHGAPNLKAFIVGSLSGSFDLRDERVDPYAQTIMEASRGLPVQFLGFISNREVLFRQYLAAADVSIVPSRREPQGLVVLESLAMGTPVIGSSTGGIPGMVSPDIGYLFPPGNSAALAACIKDAYEHPQRLRKMQLSARRRTQASYSWDGVAGRRFRRWRRPP